MTRHSNSRILNQQEIDNLLELAKHPKMIHVSGIQALISSELVSYERLPMLDVVFDRLVRLMSTSLLAILLLTTSKFL